MISFTMPDMPDATSKQTVATGECRQDGKPHINSTLICKIEVKEAYLHQASERLGKKCELCLTKNNICLGMDGRSRSGKCVWRME